MFNTVNKAQNKRRSRANVTALLSGLQDRQANCKSLKSYTQEDTDHLRSLSGSVPRHTRKGETKRKWLCPLTGATLINRSPLASGSLGKDAWGTTPAIVRAGGEVVSLFQTLTCEGLYTIRKIESIGGAA